MIKIKRLMDGDSDPLPSTYIVELSIHSLPMDDRPIVGEEIRAKPSPSIKLRSS